MTTVAVLGNTHRNPGAACAADLALAGHSVRYALFDPAPDALDALRAHGGLTLQGDPAAYFSGRIGKRPGCAAYGVRHRSLPAAIDHFYGTSGTGVYEAMLNCTAYQSFGPFPSSVWREWEAVDVPYAIVPLVRLAEQAGIGAPLHRALAEIFGTLLGIEPWSCRPTLEDMALEGAGLTVARRFLIG